jgi:hypothetical protein
VSRDHFEHSAAREAVSVHYSWMGLELSGLPPVEDLGIPFIEALYDANQGVPTVREERVHWRIGEICEYEDALTAAMRFECRLHSSGCARWSKR